MVTAQQSDTQPSSSAHQGQIIVMFAAFMVVMLGVLGLVTDLGVAFSQRRTMQSAADAGALAGARSIAKADLVTLSSVQSEVETVVRANAMNLGAINTIDCTYINDGGTSLGSCTLPMPLLATGVSVRVVEAHPTFFIRAIPGAPTSIETSARAKAYVRRFIPPSDGPFLPCARRTVLASGGFMDIMLNTGGSWTLNPLAIGKTFVLHGPNVATCSASSSRYHGVANQASNVNATTPGWFFYNEGNTINPVQTDVDGANGCRSHSEVNNCVVYVPVAVDNPVEPGNSRKLWVVGYATFYITRVKSNEHHGQLLGSYAVYGSGQSPVSGWYRGYPGPVVIRLSA